MRSLVSLALALLLALPTARAQDGDPAIGTTTVPGTGLLRGKILGPDGKTPEIGAVVKAIHLDSREIFEATAPTGRDGEFEVAGLPYGYYDIAVIAGGETLYLSNRVLNVPPDKKVSATFTLSEIRPEEREWWEAEPSRVVPGIGRRPDGVARLAQSSRDVSFWKTKKGIALLAGSGAAAIGLLVIATDSDDDVPEIQASPSEP